MWAAGNFARPGVVAGFTVSPPPTGLSPYLTIGVLFAQGTIFRPTVPPALPVMPVSCKRWIWYNTTAGFYYTATFAPTVADDALIGWAVSNATTVILVSSQSISTPAAETGGGSSGGGGGGVSGGGPLVLTFCWGRGAPQDTGADKLGHNLLVANRTLKYVTDNCALPGGTLPIVIDIQHSRDHVHWNSVFPAGIYVRHPYGSNAEATQSQIADSEGIAGDWYRWDLLDGSDQGSQMGTTKLVFE